MEEYFKRTSVLKVIDDILWSHINRQDREEFEIMCMFIRPREQF